MVDYKVDGCKTQAVRIQKPNEGLFFGGRYADLSITNGPHIVTAHIENLFTRYRGVLHPDRDHRAINDRDTHIQGLFDSFLEKPRRTLEQV